MRWVLDQCMVLLHPDLPFITEELWGLTGNRAKMVVHADWPSYGTELVDAEADREMNWVISVIENTRSARAQMRVPLGLYVPMLVTELDDHGQAAWDRNETLIKRLARIDSLTKADELPKGTISIAAPGASFGLPLADIIDIGAEKERLEKAKGKLAKELGGLRGRLNNPKFVASAPEEVVAEAKANLAAREEEEAKAERGPRPPSRNRLIFIFSQNTQIPNPASFATRWGFLLATQLSTCPHLHSPRLLAICGYNPEVSRWRTPIPPDPNHLNRARGRHCRVLQLFPDRVAGSCGHGGLGRRTPRRA